MSFGFSLGDIAAFGKFAITVSKALKEHGGSKSEFQLAERQCQGFFDIIEEVRALDLSSMPEAFRARLEEHSTNVVDLVKDFRITIESYGKSMGKHSKRGQFASAPRKVQWALFAAQDLAIFRQGLAAQLDLVKVMIQISIL